jgi:hypothetical protein
MPARLFTVSNESWVEHRKAGVAAINDPAADDPENNHLLPIRDKVMAEISGIRQGTRLYFYHQQEKTISGGFTATTVPFFDPEPLFPGAAVVGHTLPVRVGFEETAHYRVPIRMSDIWSSRDKGDIWAIQQSRGDVSGRHACVSLTDREADIIDQMLLELNPVSRQPSPNAEPPQNRNPLPYRFTLEEGKFHPLSIEAALQAAMLEGFAEGHWRDILGEYDDYLAYVPTSEGTEMDLVLIRYTPGKIPLWFLLLELKRDRFQMEHLRQLLAYETWMTASQAAGNPRMVHMVACAYRFDSDVIEFSKERSEMGQKPVHLLRYEFPARSKDPQDLRIFIEENSGS